MRPELPSIQLNELVRIHSVKVLSNTSEKIVFPAQIDGRTVAVKIYRVKSTDSELIEPVDQNLQAQDEFQMLSRLQDTVLNEYLPGNPQLLENRGKVIGLIADWRKGVALNTLYGHVQIPNHVILRLQNCFLNLPPNLWPDPDGFSEGNICWDGDNLWLAELHSFVWDPPERYAVSVNSTFQLIIQDYGSNAPLRNISQYMQI